MKGLQQLTALPVEGLQLTGLWPPSEQWPELWPEEKLQLKGLQVQRQELWLEKPRPEELQTPLLSFCALQACWMQTAQLRPPLLCSSGPISKTWVQTVSAERPAATPVPVPL